MAAAQRQPLSIHERILAYLQEARDSEFNSTNIPTSLDLISRDLRIDREIVRRECDRLWREHRIERFDAEKIYYRLPAGQPQHA